VAQGASLIYHRLLHKYLEQYETDIDGHIVKLTHHAKQAAWEVSSTVVKVRKREIRNIRYWASGREREDNKQRHVSPGAAGDIT
jgi:hypothetical protein